MSVTTRLLLLDTERVILEVQGHPELWDISHDLYKDRDARQAAWIAICGDIFKDFDDFSEHEKKAIVTKVQLRWKTARDTYNRVNANKKKLKSGSGAKKELKYSYYEMLTFLNSNSCIEGQESSDRLTCQDENSEHGTIISDSESGSNECSITRNTIKRETAGTSERKRTLSPSPFEKQLLETIKQRSIEENDEDWYFLKSIMPALKKMNTYQKLKFRSKVIDILIDIEKAKGVTVDDSSVKTDITRTN